MNTVHDTAARLRAMARAGITLSIVIDGDQMPYIQAGPSWEEVAALLAYAGQKPRNRADIPRCIARAAGLNHPCFGAGLRTSLIYTFKEKGQ